MEEHYNPAEVETRVQDYWQQKQTFTVKEDLSKEKFYCLCMFPYPSGHLHVGHTRNYTLGDVITRYQLMLGKNVLQPMGWDAFGLPAENAAIKHNVPPAQWTYDNIHKMRTQFQRLGFGYDWSREITTCKPDYYQWEQWLFIQLFKKGLVYRKNSFVNWDPVDNTVLANEQVVNGRGWRSGALIERREISQWFLKITDYAEELLKGLDDLTEWPEQVRTMQRNWIGRSEGTEIIFQVENSDQTLEVFTTRPDTFMGATYLAIAAQHPLAKLAAKNNPAIEQFIDECNKIKVAEADMATLEKRGIVTPFNAIHPLTQKKLPIWIANFVVMDYGSGAVMCVPAHDQRDYEFAQKYQLPIQQVIEPIDNSPIILEEEAFTHKGRTINSGEFNGLNFTEACEAITEKLNQHKQGRKKITYRLRDWGISRQRYWGTPIPMIHCNNCGDVPVSEKDLPVLLPENVSFTGAISPLNNMPEFYQTICPECGNNARRETDTFDTFMESSWYYARYASFNQDKAMLDARANYWVPVDHYIGGIEHAVMHLLYSRFIHKVLRDENLLNSDEPFKRLLTQGMVLKDGAKMSKSKGNTVDPQELIDRYGADTLRLFMMFAAPPEQSLEWSDSGVEGSYRFLKRLWQFAYKYQTLIQQYNDQYKGKFNPIDWDEIALTQQINDTTLKTLRNIHKETHAILKKACYDMEICQFNTVVSAAMKLLNILNDIPNSDGANGQSSDAYSALYNRLIAGGMSILLRLLHPITPHITHTLWQELDYGSDILKASWPKIIKSALKSEEVDMIVQVNGKLRAKISVPTDMDNTNIEKLALSEENVQRFVSGKHCEKVIIVPGKLINIVVK
ncbi:MAG: leucine--tRNA ligase [Legionellales bacterium]|nr:leucine--tRNA ligase [Legionellales bacterium]